MSDRGLRWTLVGASIYFLVFTAMNWQLYRGLLTPHGDTGMYEEHLWNVLHGKGFRSDLDPGLFLGEHLQVIHSLLLPAYLVWPSHLLLELCESLALASGAIAVFFLAGRHAGSSKAATWMALAYLLAIPMQFLDIAIDLKTFRPTAFVIPLLLFALDQMERARFKTMILLLVVTLSAQEDLALVLAPLGVWMAVTGFRNRRSSPSAVTDQTAVNDAKQLPPIWMGAAIAVLSTVYLGLALKVLIPLFREGADAHYTSYFGELGESPGEIAHSIFSRPHLFFGKLFSSRSLLYAVLLIVPYGGLPLRSPGRLLIAAPLFAVLCLMDTTSDPAKSGSELLVPFHHFHAPLVPIIVWSAIAGLRATSKPSGKDATRSETTFAQESGRARFIGLRRARFAAACALTTGFFFSLSPAGIAFWDPGSRWHFARLYIPGRRAELFPLAFEQIPRSARVASTDFIHPRFTHFARSYDYSHFRRRVSGWRDAVPDDTDYIVIDTQHPYSDIKRLEDARELKTEPEKWTPLPDRTEGYFLILKRTKPEAPP